MSGYNWTNEDVYKLIKMFQVREVLWNTKSEDYKDRNKKHDAWIEIANEFNLDKKVIEKKIRSLVGQFNRECKPKFGAGVDDSSKWFAFKKLMFLKDKNIPSSTVGGGLQNKLTNAESASIRRFNIVKRLGNIRSVESSRTANNVQLNHILNSISRLEKISTQMSESEDEYDLFGRSIALHLKKLPEHAGLELMQKIQSLVTDTRILYSQNHGEIISAEEYEDSQGKVLIEVPH